MPFTFKLVGGEWTLVAAKYLLLQTKSFYEVTKFSVDLDAVSSAAMEAEDIGSDAFAVSAESREYLSQLGRLSNSGGTRASLDSAQYEARKESRHPNRDEDPQAAARRQRERRRHQRLVRMSSAGEAANILQAFPIRKLPPNTEQLDRRPLCGRSENMGTRAMTRRISVSCGAVLTA